MSGNLPKPGTYQTTIVTETWVMGQNTPRVQYRTTFGGKVIEHNSILELVRALHSENDGQASALIDVLEDAKTIKAIRKLKREGLNNWTIKGDYYWLKISEILEAKT